MSEYKRISIVNDRLRPPPQLRKSLALFRERWLRAVEEDAALEKAAQFTAGERKRMVETISGIAETLGIKSHLHALLEVLDARAARIERSAPRRRKSRSRKVAGND
jgi:hypothetical protein